MSTMMYISVVNVGDFTDIKNCPVRFIASTFWTLCSLDTHLVSRILNIFSICFPNGRLESYWQLKPMTVHNQNVSVQVPNSSTNSITKVNLCIFFVLGLSLLLMFGNSNVEAFKWLLLAT